MKICNKCGESKVLEDFSKDKYKADGRCTHCKECHKSRPSKPGASLYKNLSPKALENERIRKRTRKHLYKDAVAATNRRTYVKRKQLSIECTTKEVKEFMTQNTCCVKCGASKDLTLDHIIPVSWIPLSRHALDNFQVLCNYCNGAKKNLESIDYRPIEADINFDIRDLLTLPFKVL